LIASLISAPAALMLARLMVPESKSGREESETFFMPSSEAQNFMEAIVTGTMNGVKLLINVIAMLVVLVALVHLANQILGLLPDWNGENLTLQRILGWIMAPVTWLIGIPWDQAPAAGALMGTKTILNEFIAYLNLAKLPAGTLDPRSRIIMVYALCGFANFGSLGIMIGGLTAMAPERRSEIVGLGLKSILAGTLATMMTGAVVGIIL
jgi:CNT family concentrative nucleoside transporter